LAFGTKWSKDLAATAGSSVTTCADMAARSAAPGEHSISLLGDDLFALLDALNFKNVHLVGPSIGGMITQSVAATAEAVHLLALERPKELIELIGGFLERAS
jgi:pimeloyl-ACP methyl ester carboxylesterase